MSATANVSRMKGVGCSWSARPVNRKIETRSGAGAPLFCGTRERYVASLPPDNGPIVLGPLRCRPWLVDASPRPAAVGNRPFARRQARTQSAGIWREDRPAYATPRPDRLIPTGAAIVGLAVLYDYRFTDRATREKTGNGNPWAFTARSWRWQEMSPHGFEAKLTGVA